MIQLLNSSCNHEMLAPIKCIIQIAEQTKQFVAEFDGPTVIYNTASFLLNQVQSNLDQSLLEQDKLQLRLENKLLQEEVV